MELLVVLVLAIPVLAIVAIIVAASASGRVGEAERRMNARLKRLEADLQSLRASLDEHPAETPPPMPTQAEESAFPPPLGVEAAEEIPKPTVPPVSAPPPLPFPEEEVETPTPAEDVFQETGETPASEEMTEAVVVPAPVRTVSATPVKTSKTRSAKKHHSTLEERIGGRWFNWIGVVALLIGAGYLIKYAHDQGWISAWTQFGIGIAVSVVLLGAGHIAERRKYPYLARGFWGAGIGLLFLVLFAGYRVHGILSQPAAFTGMTLATMLGAALSIVYRARSAAVLSAIGGYLTPLLLSSGVPRQGFLFTYLAILTAGLLVIGYWRSWRFLRPLALGASFAWFVAWGWRYDAGDPDLMVCFVCIFFALASAEVAAWSAWRRAPSDWQDLGTLGLASVLHLVVGLTLLVVRRPDAVGPFLLATAAWHGVGAWLVRRRHEEDLMLARAFGCAGAVVFLLFPPLDHRLAPYGVGIAWAVQGLLLFQATRLGGGRWARLWSLGALLLAAARLLVVDTPRHFVDVEPYRIFLTWRGVTYGVLIAAFVMAYRWFRRIERREPAPARSPAGPGKRAARATITVFDAQTIERLLVTLAVVVSATLPIVFLSLELRDAFAHYVRPAFGDAEAAWAKTTSYWMTLLWVVYTTVLLTVVRRRGSLVLTRLGLAMGVVVLWKFTAIDIAHAYEPETTPILNERFLVFTALAAGLFWLHREYRRQGPEITTLPRVGSLLLVLAHVAVQCALALEWTDFVSARAPTGAFANAGILGLAALATVHGTNLTLLAARRKSPSLLVPGLGFLGVALFEFVVLVVLKSPTVAVHAFAHLRFLVGIGIAGGLFVAAWAVRRAGEEDPETAERWNTRTWFPVLACAGHLTLLATLGLEACDIFRRNVDAWTPESALSVVAGPMLGVIAVTAIYAGALLVSGIVKARPHARGMALFLLAATFVATVIVVFASDTERVETVLLNTRFLLAGTLVLALFLGAESYRRWGATLEGEARLGEVPDATSLRVPLSLLGHALALLLLTMEAGDYFTAQGGGDDVEGISAADARQLSFSVVWAVYAIGMIVSGVLRGFRPMRLMALVLLLVTIFKVFLFDLSFLENPYRILSFIVLGLILVGVSYVYGRYKTLLFGEDEDVASPDAEATETNTS